MNKFLIGLSLLLSFLTASAEEIRPHIKVSVVSDFSKAKQGEKIRIGFLAVPEEGWHIYWKHPGDSGRAPNLNWTIPSGVLLSESRWPTPKEISVGPLVNYGYEGPTIIYHETTMPAGDLNGSLQANWLVCEENCVPGEAAISFTVPHGAESIPSEYAKQFDTTEASLPMQTDLFSITQTRKDQLMLLTVQSASGAPLPTSLKFLSNRKQQIDHGAEQKILRTGDSVMLEIPLSKSAPKNLSSISGILTSPQGFDNHQAILVGGDPEITTVTYKPSSTVHWRALLGTLWFALLGGLLLNIMPCVFPVLSIKIINLIQDDDAAHRTYGNFYSIGVILSFALIGAAFLALRIFGATYGWGFQLQYPPFVFGLIVLLTLVALNLIGVFEVGATIQHRAGRVCCSSCTRGAFLSGVLATLVSTPCTAPFMGVALAAAVSLPLWVGFSIFLALGVGMALPFFIISHIPSVSRFLPKPGAWMEIAKKFFSFPIFATVVWLLWVYGKQTDVENLTKVLGTLVGVSFAAWIYGTTKLPSRSYRTRMFGKVATAILMTWALWFGLPTSHAITQSSKDNVYRDTHDQVWIPYSKEVVQNLRMEGKPMYLDFTASWCITCQVNKAIVFSSEEVRKEISDRNVTLIRGDWTSENPEISEALHTYGAEGVPLNIVYTTDKTRPPLVLPALLTPAIVLKALRE